jgi:hypothetical protein
MAKSTALLTEGNYTAGGTTTNTASIAPSAGAVAIWVFAYGTATVSATGNGLTYSEVINEASVDGGRLFCLVGAGASPSSGVVALTFDNDAFVNWKIVNVTGTIQTSGPTNTNHAEADGTSTTPAVTLGAFAHASNGVLAYIYAIDAVTITEGTGFSMIDANAGSAMFGHSDAVTFRDSNDTSVDGTLSSSAAWGIAALELVDTASAGGSTPKRFQLLGVG